MPRLPKAAKSNTAGAGLFMLLKGRLKMLKGNFNPRGKVTRAEAAAVIARALELKQ